MKAGAKRSPPAGGIHTKYLRLALRLARRAYGFTSPNPMVGAVLVKNGKIIGQGWHHRAGSPHAEIEALADARKYGHSPRGATLYVTLEPCCTHGRTPPCTRAIVAAGLRCVVVGATDPNPHHAGKGLDQLRHAGVTVIDSNGWAPRLSATCTELNEAFNHWIVHQTPFVVVKAAMTLDGKIATAAGESKWITGEAARAAGMALRRGSDAIMAGIATVLADDPSLTVRSPDAAAPKEPPGPIRRIILDSMARTPLSAKVVSDAWAATTTIVVSRQAPARRVAALRRRANVLVAPLAKSSASHPKQPRTIDLRWLLRRLGADKVTRLLVEGGGEVNAAFLLGGHAHRVAFFYAPKVLGGRAARKGVSGEGATGWPQILKLEDLRWRNLGADLMLTAKIVRREARV